MSDPLHVLVWGHANDGPCAFFRGYQYDEPLRELGVEMRHISQVNFRPAKGWEGVDPADALKAGKMEVDTTDLDWADVIVMRRYYNTSITCSNGDPLSGGCIFRSHQWDDALAHQEQTGHAPKTQDSITRIMWPVIRDQTHKAVLYETDDLHVRHGVAKWNGYWPDVQAEQPLVEEMLRRADIVTASTPRLAENLRYYNDRVRVVRNSITPEMYERTAPRPPGDKVRVGYYGSTARMRDYAGHPRDYMPNGEPYGPWVGGWAKAAVDYHRKRGEVTTVFIGTNEGTEHVVERLGFDEQVGYITGIPAFSRALADAHMDIGLAPLGGDMFDACKSELHWLEYTVAGAATIATRFMGDGPYNIIRDGVDGILAKNKYRDWADGMKRLVESKTLREEIHGNALERVMREYDYRVRAKEWADVFRWAAEHRGIGMAGKAA